VAKITSAVSTSQQDMGGSFHLRESRPVLRFVSCSSSLSVIAEAMAGANGKSYHMNSFAFIWRRFLRDERAAEVTELGIVLAMLVAGSVAAITLIGPTIAKFYQDTNDVLSG
jgi:Flp pilus assembly pilin Flp